MTAQVCDTLDFEGDACRIEELDGALFDPATLGWRLARISNANTRGYVARYAIRDDRLVRTRLIVRFAQASVTYAESFFRIGEVVDGAVAWREIKKPRTRIGETTVALVGAELFLEDEHGRRAVSEGTVFHIQDRAFRAVITGGVSALLSIEAPSLGSAEGVCQRDEREWGNVLYDDLAVPATFTGRIRIEARRIEDLTFVSGELIARVDHTREVREARAKREQAAMSAFARLQGSLDDSE